MSSDNTQELMITRDGSIRFIFNDDLVDLLELGDASIERASHVEPCGKQWLADLSPSGGPVLGPFAKRREALAAEIHWLRQNNLGQRHRTGKVA